MKAAVVTQDHQVDVTEKTLRPLRHGEALLKMECCGFFIPKAFGTSLALTGSPVGAMKIFLLFYIACVLLTWLVYGRRKPKQQ
ncbi:hypothetical protein E9436_06315 [Salmonella enterica]|nr:hypothetical protein [Salmonella enterica]